MTRDASASYLRITPIIWDDEEAHIAMKRVRLRMRSPTQFAKRLVSVLLFILLLVC